MSRSFSSFLILPSFLPSVKHLEEKIVIYFNVPRSDSLLLKKSISIITEPHRESFHILNKENSIRHWMAEVFVFAKKFIFIPCAENLIDVYFLQLRQTNDETSASCPGNFLSSFRKLCFRGSKSKNQKILLQLYEDSLREFFNFLFSLRFMKASITTSQITPGFLSSASQNYFPIHVIFCTLEGNNAVIYQNVTGNPSKVFSSVLRMSWPVCNLPDQREMRMGKCHLQGEEGNHIVPAREKVLQDATRSKGGTLCDSCLFTTSKSFSTPSPPVESIPISLITPGFLSSMFYEKPCSVSGSVFTFTPAIPQPLGPIGSEVSEEGSQLSALRNQKGFEKDPMGLRDPFPSQSFPTCECEQVFVTFCGKSTIHQIEKGAPISFLKEQVSEHLRIPPDSFYFTPFSLSCGTHSFLTVNIRLPGGAPKRQGKKGTVKQASQGLALSSANPTETPQPKSVLPQTTTSPAVSSSLPPNPAEKSLPCHPETSSNPTKTPLPPNITPAIVDTPSLPPSLSSSTAGDASQKIIHLRRRKIRVAPLVTPNPGHLVNGFMTAPSRLAPDKSIQAPAPGSLLLNQNNVINSVQTPLVSPAAQQPPTAPADNLPRDSQTPSTSFRVPTAEPSERDVNANTSSLSPFDPPSLETDVDANSPAPISTPSAPSTQPNTPSASKSTAAKKAGRRKKGTTKLRTKQIILDDEDESPEKQSSPSQTPPPQTSPSRNVTKKKASSSKATSTSSSKDSSSSSSLMFSTATSSTPKQTGQSQASKNGTLPSRRDPMHNACAPIAVVRLLHQIPLPLLDQMTQGASDFGLLILEWIMNPDDFEAGRKVMSQVRSGISASDLSPDAEGRLDPVEFLSAIYKEIPVLKQLFLIQSKVSTGCSCGEHNWREEETHTLDSKTARLKESTGAVTEWPLQCSFCGRPSAFRTEMSTTSELLLVTFCRPSPRDAAAMMCKKALLFSDGGRYRLLGGLEHTENWGGHEEFRLSPRQDLCRALLFTMATDEIPSTGILQDTSLPPNRARNSDIATPKRGPHIQKGTVSFMSSNDAEDNYSTSLAGSSGNQRMRGRGTRQSSGNENGRNQSLQDHPIDLSKSSSSIPQKQLPASTSPTTDPPLPPSLDRIICLYQPGFPCKKIKDALKDAGVEYERFSYIFLNRCCYLLFESKEKASSFLMNGFEIGDRQLRLFPSRKNPFMKRKPALRVGTFDFEKQTEIENETPFLSSNPWRTVHVERKAPARAQRVVRLQSSWPNESAEFLDEDSGRVLQQKRNFPPLRTVRFHNSSSRPYTPSQPAPAYQHPSDLNSLPPNLLDVPPDLLALATRIAAVIIQPSTCQPFRLQ